MKKLLLLFVVIPAVYFAFNSTLWFENPVMIFDSPREYLNLSDFQIGINLDQNLLSIDDLMTMAKGSEVILDESKLELMKEGFKFFPMVSMSEHVGFGFGSFRLGINANVENGIRLTLPKELTEVLFGKVDTNTTKESTFNILSGSLFAKTGLNLGFGIGKNLKVGVEIGAYVPILWFDDRSQSHFFYRSDEETATVEMKIDGNVRFLSAVPNVKDFDISTDELLEGAGYYASFGAMMSFGKLRVVAGLNDVSIQPAKLSYEGYSRVSFEASLSNLEFGSSGPNVEIPDDLSQLPTPEDVQIPMKIFAAAEYRTSFINLVAHFKSTTDFSEKEFGAYVDLANVLWMDFTSVGVAWRKMIGLNLDLRFLRMTASIGVIDYAGILNFDTSKMTGLSISMGFGVGF